MDTEREDEGNDNSPIASTSRDAQIERKKTRRNRPYASSLKDLLRRHKRLTAVRVEISSREGKVPKIPHGSLLTTVVRMHVSVKNKSEILRDLFFDLFREHSESKEEGFEVVVTFNAVLHNQVSFFTFFQLLKKDKF